MSKIKIVLFDSYGVLIRPPHYFTKELDNKGFRNAEQSWKVCFGNGEFNQCNKGEASTTETIEPFLKEIDWKEPASEYLRKQYLYESEYLDRDMVSTIKNLRKKGIKCYLAVVNEKERLDFSLKELNFKKIFDGKFVSCQNGFLKYEDAFWEYVLKNLNKEFENLNAKEIVYFDDSQENINVASKFGIQALLFKNSSQFKQELKNLSL